MKKWIFPALLLIIGFLALTISIKNFLRVKETLPPAERSAEVNWWIGKLHHQDADMRKGAVAKLGGLGDKRALPHLIEMLKDANGGVRRNAVNALAKFKDKELVDEIAPMLEDPAPSVRMAAISALGKLRDERAVGPLLEMMEKDENTIGLALYVLGKIGSPKAVPVLSENLSSDKFSYRIAALRALDKMGDDRALPALKKFAENPFKDSDKLKGESPDYLAKELPTYKEEANKVIEGIEKRYRK